MLRKTLTAYLSLTFIFVTLSVSCDLFGNDPEIDCGPFDEHFETIDFISEFGSISFPEETTSDFQFNPLDSDTIGFDEFGLAVYPVKEYYSLNSKSARAFTVFNFAYACTPLIPTSEEEILSIEIFSNQAFNSEYSSNENLANLFDIITPENGYQRADLNDFLSTNPVVPLQIFLALKSAPDTTEPLQFTVRYSQNGINVDYIEFVTEPVVITD